MAGEPLHETTLDGLLAEFRGLADSKRMAGNYLEQLARHHLTVEPLWADQLGAVWLWKDWPGRGGRPDTGIDLVAEIQCGGLLAVQVKFFAETHRMQKGDLDSFFEAMGKEPFTEGLVIDTTSAPWSVNAEEALKNRTKPVRRVSLAELRHSSIDWSTYELLKPEIAPERHALKTLRAHQHEAVQAVMEGLKPGSGHDRGKLVMACGTGKTFTALKLAERWTNEISGGASTVQCGRAGRVVACERSRSCQLCARSLEQGGRRARGPRRQHVSSPASDVERHPAALREPARRTGESRAALPYAGHDDCPR